ncbi:MAG: LD-carboxypeptidase, partial [Vicinamibacteria bacterium]|nr:LD-carboxypeptidase [Vicinamibacteria bacterium]
MSRQVARPVRLQAGDLIGLCAPSGYVEIERLHAGAAALERLGFRVLVPEGLFDQSGFTAGSVARRVQELRSLFANDAVRGIVCARGGAGAFQLLPHLFDREWTAPAKVFQGYSDITFLHTALNARGCVTFHGPMAARGLDQAFDEDSLR